MENRNALIVDADLGFADGCRTSASGAEMLARLPRDRPGAGPWPATRATTPRASSPACAELKFTPHVAQNTEPTTSAIDGAPPATPATPCRAHPQARRGNLRLDQDHRRRPTTSLPRPRPQPGLVQDHHRRLQPPPNRRARHPAHLTDRKSRHSGTHRLEPPAPRISHGPTNEEPAHRPTPRSVTASDTRSSPSRTAPWGCAPHTS